MSLSNGFHTQHDEYQYLNLIRDIIKTGKRKGRIFYKNLNYESEIYFICR